MRFGYSSISLVATLLVVLVACSTVPGGGTTATVEPGKPTTITVGGATLELPAGEYLILTDQGVSPFELTLEQDAANAGIDLSPGEIRLSPLFTLSHDQDLEIPLTAGRFGDLTLPFDPALLPAGVGPTTINVVVKSRTTISVDGDAESDGASTTTVTFGEITLGGAITVSLAGLPELADIAVVYAPSLVVVAADSHSTTTAAEPAWETIKAQVAYNEADESIMASLGVAAGTTDPAGIRQWVHENLQVPAEMSLRHYRDVGARSLNLPIVELEPNDKRFQFAIQYYELLDSAAFKPPTTDPFGAIIIDPDFLSEIDEFTVSCGLTLAETVHHELFHAVFRAYDIRALGRGLTRAGYWIVVGRGYDEGLATTVSRSHISGASAGNAAVRTCTKSEVFPLGLNFGDGVREGRQYGNQDVFAYLERAYTRDGFAFLWGG